jgi:hypothetical protein
MSIAAWPVPLDPEERLACCELGVGDPRCERRSSAGRFWSRSLGDVEVIGGGSLDPNDYLSVGRRIGHLLELEDLGTACFIDHHRTHCLLLAPG